MGHPSVENTAANTTNIEEIKPTIKNDKGVHLDASIFRKHMKHRSRLYALM